MRGVGDETQVRFMVFVQRSRNTDDDSIHRGDLGIVGGGGKALCLGGLDFPWSDAIDVRGALRKGIDLAGINIESGYFEFLFAVKKREGKSDIAALVRPMASN